MRKNIDRMALSPNGTLLVVVDKGNGRFFVMIVFFFEVLNLKIDGRALLINLNRRTVLSHMNFKARARAVKFSPDGKYFAITHEKNVNIWKAPSHTREFAPFILLTTCVGHHDLVTNINWSPDSK